MAFGSAEFPGEGQEDEKPAGIVFLGMTLTPTILGAIAAVAGLGLAVYVFFNLVQPESEKQDKINKTIQETEIKKKEVQNKLQQKDKLQAEFDEAKQKKDIVLSLFAMPESLNTLSMDINRQIELRKATMVRFEPKPIKSTAPVDPKAPPKDPSIVDDGSFGPAANGKIKRQLIDVGFEGNFEQVQSILRSIERLQPLLVFDNFKAELDKSEQQIAIDSSGKIIPVGNAETIVKTSFQVQVIIPVSSEELAAATPSTPPPGQPGAPAATPPK